MAKLTADEYAKIRAMVEDGKLSVGSPAHLSVIVADEEMSKLSRRDNRIIRLAIRGLTHWTIAEQVGLSRARVSSILREFFGG